MWLKYRHKWAHGFKQWDWMYYADVDKNQEGTDKPSVIYEMEDENQYLDHYRGIEYEFVKDDDVPAHVLYDKISEAEKNIKYWTRQKKTYSNFMHARLAKLG